MSIVTTLPADVRVGDTVTTVVTGPNNTTLTLTTTRVEPFEDLILELIVAGVL